MSARMPDSCIQFKRLEESGPVAEYACVRLTLRMLASADPQHSDGYDRFEDPHLFLLRTTRVPACLTYRASAAATAQDAHYRTFLWCDYVI
jgi:hypothetical protein